MMEIINKFINANEKMLKKENIKLTYKVYIIFLVLMLCLLPFAGGFIGISGIIIILLYSIAACVYNHSIINNPSTYIKNFMSYFLLIGYLFIIFNLMLYSIPKLMKLNLDIFIILIIVFEIFSMAFGCSYTSISIKKDRIKEYKQANVLTISIISTLSGCWTIFLKRYVSKTPIGMQAFIILAFMAISCCVYAFYIGKIFIPMLYFIKIYNINEIDFTNEAP
jgi:hypothetical protein